MKHFALNQFLLKTDEVWIDVVECPERIETITELPNWRVMLWDDKEKEPKAVWLRINLRRFRGATKLDSATTTAFAAFMKKTVKDPVFIKAYGKLTYLPHERQYEEQYAPETSLGMELSSYLTRRGKNFETKIVGGFGKDYMPRLYLRLGCDVFLTTDMHGTRTYPMNRKVSVLGSVKVGAGNKVGFEMYHPFLDLRERISSKNLVRDINKVIESNFPFAKGVFHDWEFLNLVENTNVP